MCDLGLHAKYHNHTEVHLKPNFIYLEIKKFQAGKMIYIFFGSLGILIWKCGTQLLCEAKYRSLNQEEEDRKKKAKITRISKYPKIMY